MLQRHGYHRDVRAALGVGLAAEALAETAILALAEPHAVRVYIGLRCVGGRPREGMLAQAARGLADLRRGPPLHQRRQRIVSRPRRLERIAARLDRALQVSG